MIEVVFIIWNLGLTALVVLLVYCQSNQAEILKALDQEIQLLRDDGK